MPDSDPASTPQAVPSDSHDDATREGNDVRIGAGARVGQIAVGENISQNYYAGEVEYDVRGLANPYLGLSSFIYADRAKYAGHEKRIAETVTQLTAPGAAIPLLFITGASGSGKSSFAQAGLVPALETHYAALTVKLAVVRPGANPLAALADGMWRQLGLPLLDTGNLSPDAFSEFLRANTPASQVNVIILDQFEECFTQSAAPSRDVLFEILTHLPPFAQTRTHIIATMRADYLPELFNYSALYEIAIRGTALRAMSVDELRNAIQQPLRAGFPSGDKKFEPSLVERLAQDAALDAAYLPLLQVTLEEIWRKGSLTPGAYSNLTDAIEERADKVLKFHDYNDASPNKPRTKAEQDALLELLLKLVNVSLDDEARHDARRRRTKSELTQGSGETAHFVDELARARLLSVEAEAGDAEAEVDLIHESLLVNWERLRAAIAERRHELHQRARFEQHLDEWQAQNRSDDYLLDGVRLAEARELEGRDDIALQSADGKAFLRASVAKVEAERQQELERERQRAEAEERARREAEKSAAAEKQRARILRFAAIGLSMLLLVAIAASILAFRANQEANQQRDAAVQADATSQAQAIARATAEASALSALDTANQQKATAQAERNRAEAENRIARSRELAAVAINQLQIDPERAPDCRSRE